MTHWLRERLMRELAGELSGCEPHAASRDALELARAAVCLICDRSSAVWVELTSALCRLALNPPEKGGFPRKS